ncbi:fluoride efflux transporter CrcB [Neobacillus niacini]|uniref:fluoride efflux transporter CrcB n=1 Tax=Neobacillus niacini TaxID=86668 RepID=UPI00398337F4
MIWLIGLGGSLGAAVRYLLGLWVNTKMKSEPFPLATWLINISGSFLLGLLVNLRLSNDISEWFWFLAGVGFCGAYTTFSTFGFETLSLLQSKKKELAGIYVLSSLIASVLAAAIGFII